VAERVEARGGSVENDLRKGSPLGFGMTDVLNLAHVSLYPGSRRPRALPVDEWEPAFGRDVAPLGREEGCHACLPVGRGYVRGAPHAGCLFCVRDDVSPSLGEVKDDGNKENSLNSR
jgi:hypothetical protein